MPNSEVRVRVQVLEHREQVASQLGNWCQCQKKVIHLQASNCTRKQKTATEAAAAAAAERKARLHTY